MRRGTHRLVPLGLLLLAGCSPPDATQGTRPLLDGSHAPEVLIEEAGILQPPADSGNRYVRGWVGRRRRGKVWLIPYGERSVLEGVFLDGRERRITLLLDIWQTTEGATVGVKAGGIELPPVPFARPLELPLPPDMPLGRQPIELDFRGSQMIVEGAGFGHAWRPGAVRFEDGAIAQSGYSAIDFSRRLDAPGTLVGRFEPPADAGEDQRFAVLVDTDEGEAVTTFEWRPGRLAGLLGSRRLSVELPAGLVRVRLLAQGLGRPARWRGLGLAGQPEPPEPAPASPPAAPRLVILYVMDALRADALGHLGGAPDSSPVIDRMAAEGVTFGRYYSTTPETASSTKVLLSGLPVLTTGHRQLAEEGVETLGQLYTAADYRTAVFTANETAVLYGATRGFEHDDRSVRFDAGATVNDSAARVHTAALDWLDSLGEGERAFAYLHTLHPHTPYSPPGPYIERFTAGIDSEIDGSSRTVLDIKHARRQADDEDRRRIAALYRANLAYNDELIGELLAELGRRYAPGEVLFVLTSDHGEELFDHGGVLHGFTLHEEQLHIPLVMWWPDRLAPRRIDTVADNQDLNATLRALVGAPPARGDGDSLWGRVLGAPRPAGSPAVRFAAAASVEGGIFMAASDRYKLILAPRTGIGWGMGAGLGRSRDPEYVFDLSRDPAETRNLAGTTALEVAWLRARLNAWVERGKLLEAGGEAVELDDETRAHLEALGYLD